MVTKPMITPIITPMYNMAELTKTFTEGNYWGVLTCIDLKGCRATMIRSPDYIKCYVESLCDFIGMKRFRDTVVVHFGETEKVSGNSMTQFIESSLISGHFVNSTNNAHIDIFSCKLYDPWYTEDYSKNFFEASSSKKTIILR